MPKIHYRGNVNLEYGGVFYTLHNANYHYVDAVRITPCSDVGGPDNCFWIEPVSVDLPSNETKMQQVLAVIGFDFEEFKNLSISKKLHLLVHACLSYGSFDQESSTMIRIGKPDEFYSGREGEFNPEIILRAGSSLRNYAMKIARSHCC